MFSAILLEVDKSKLKVSKRISKFDSIYIPGKSSLMTIKTSLRPVVIKSSKTFIQVSLIFFAEERAEYRKCLFYLS